MAALHRTILSTQVVSAYRHLSDVIVVVVLQSQYPVYCFLLAMDSEVSETFETTPRRRCRAPFSTPMCGHVTAKHEPMSFELLTLARNARQCHVLPRIASFHPISLRENVQTVVVLLQTLQYFYC
jgi:hypothetical protein